MSDAPVPPAPASVFIVYNEKGGLLGVYSKKDLADAVIEKGGKAYWLKNNQTLHDSALCAVREYPVDSNLADDMWFLYCVAIHLESGKVEFPRPARQRYNGTPPAWVQDSHEIVPADGGFQLVYSSISGEDALEKAKMIRRVWLIVQKEKQKAERKKAGKVK